MYLGFREKFQERISTKQSSLRGAWQQEKSKSVNSLNFIKVSKMKMIVSCNLNNDSEKVYQTRFKGKKGDFSRYINEHLKRDFLNDPKERLKNAKIKRLEEINVLKKEIQDIDKILNGEKWKD